LRQLTSLFDIPCSIFDILLLNEGDPLQAYRLINKVIFVSSVILAALLAFPVSALTSEHTVEKAAEKAIEKAVEKVTDKITEDKIDKAIEKAVEKASEKPLKKEGRPEQWRGPTKVEFLIFVIDIDKIDGSAQSFSANFHIKLSWKDRRLAEKTDSVRIVPLEKIWSPRIVLVNQGGNVWESLPRVADVTPDGTVTYRQRYVGPLSQPLMLSDFPMDEHRFTIQLIASGHRSGDLEFIPEVTLGFSGGGISEKLSLTDWEIVNFEASPRPYKPVADLSVPGFAFEFTAKRHFLYYLWQVILPLALIVMMSLSVLWIDRSNAGAQIGLATSAMLALITYRFILARLLPKLPYMTRMDYFTLGSTLLVFLALIEVIVTAALHRDKHERTVHIVEKFARFAFPVLFLLMFGWFLSGLWKY
jgi:hypothetical protein